MSLTPRGTGVAFNLDQIVQRPQALQGSRPGVTYTVELDRIRPVIRIAHQRVMAKPIGPRVIVDHEVVYLRSGRARYRTADGDQSLRKGSCLFIPPFVPHLFEPEGPAEHLAIHFDLTEYLPPRGANLKGREPYAVHPTGTAGWPAGMVWPPEHPMADALQRIVSDFATGSELATAAAQARLAVFLLEWLRLDSSEDHRSRPAHQARLQRAADWLHENLHRDIGAEDLAEHAGLSVTHFRRLFRAWAGLSVAEFLQRARVAHARQLLHDPDLSVKQIAARSGFPDPFHFSRVFRRVDGLSPTQFREAALAGRRS